MVHDEDLQRLFIRLQFEPQLLSHCREYIEDPVPRTVFGFYRELAEGNSAEISSIQTSFVYDWSSGGSR